MTPVFDVAAVQAYLRAQGLCGAETLTVSVLSGGEGNCI
jgi:hypothetical protein